MSSPRVRTGLALPDFPWDQLTAAATAARAHPAGMIDLSVGSPVDPTPTPIADALRDAADAPSYPAAAGSPQLRETMVSWFQRRRGAAGLTIENVIPTVGSKEAIALLALALGLKAGDVVVHPEIAYPTYAVSAQAVGAIPIAADDPARWPEETALVWLNSPSNPDGRVLGVSQLRDAVARAREIGAVIVADECYAELNWAGSDPTPSLLSQQVVGENRSGVLVVHSLSKQSNLAGYRAAMLAGCRKLVTEVLQVRKHFGLVVPSPVQAAMVAALSDDNHVKVQKERYRARRTTLAAALNSAGYSIDDSQAGLYLWATKGTDCWESIRELAAIGILAAPGAFYGSRSSKHVRLALTAPDAAIAQVAARLSQLL